MNKHLTEPRLIKAIKDGKYMGAAALYDQYAAIIFKVIWCTVRDQSIAGEIMEDTFLYVCTNIDHYQPQNGRLLLWMTGIARSLAKERSASIETDKYKISSASIEITPTNPFNFSA